MASDREDVLIYSDMPPPDLNVCKLRRAIRQMVYDDLLTCGDYGLEYLVPLLGYPYYRLNRCGLLVGIVDIRAAYRLPEIHHHLALFLDELGCCADDLEIIIFGAQTAPDANKHRIPHLFRVG